VIFRRAQVAAMHTRLPMKSRDLFSIGCRPSWPAGRAMLLALALLCGCNNQYTTQVTTFFKTGGQKIATAAGHEKNALTLTDKDEDGIGQAVGVRLASQYGICDRKRMLKYVTLVGLTVASASPNPGGNYVFGILDTDQINAFSGPNGYIFVTRGALQQMKDEAELAGVLGHEISHVCHHDGLKQVRLAEQQGAIDSAVSATEVEKFSQMADQGMDAIARRGYSQPQEFAADDSGVQIMNQAGYDPTSYLRFLQRLAQLQTTGGGAVMSTHPGIHDRVTRVQAQLATLPHRGTATLASRFAANVDFTATTQTAQATPLIP
jgi:predicted Zn-dependent protease